MMKLSMFKNDSPSSIFYGMSSVIGLVFTAIYTGVSVFHNDFNLSTLAIIITLAVINSLLAFILFQQSVNYYGLVKDKSSSDIVSINKEQNIKNLKYKLLSESKKMDEVSFVIHNIQDQLRNVMSKLVATYETLLTEKEKVTQSDILDILRITKSYHLYVVDNIKNMFDSLTGSRCSVCIKIVDGFVDDNDAIISTLIRDTSSYRVRNSNDSLSNKAFLWHENTAFKDILSETNPQKYYASDDLSKENSYVNINSNWKSFYNATLVIPIRLGFHENYGCEVDNSVLGFICIDNMGGKLNNNIAINLLASIADSLYLYFTYLEDIMDLKTEIESDGGHKVE